MNIGILGTRGIPNRYGGFERLAEKLSVGLHQRGHAVTVYNSHKHPYKEKKYFDVDIVHCYDAEYKWGTAGQFVYDYNCIKDAAKRNFDVLLFLGYTSSSIWGRFFPKQAVIVSNMDGMEWKRSKYKRPTRKFLQYAEKLAVRYSHHLIADSPVIQSYLENKYHKSSELIAYGADINMEADEKYLQTFDVRKNEYYLILARMEPENNVELILDGFVLSKSKSKIIVIGNADNAFGRKLKRKFSNEKGICFAGAFFDYEGLHALKHYCRLYFHGHSVGGTNPSLLEAMASGAVIAAHDNEFNRSVLGDDGFYFSSKKEVSELIDNEMPGNAAQQKIENNLAKVKRSYNWPMIIDQYEKYLLQCFNASGN